MGARSELQRQDDLAALVEVSCRPEPEVPVEGLRSSGARNAARQQLGRPVLADDLCDQPHNLTAVAAALLSLVDEQRPEEPRPDDPGWLRNDVPAEHHEPDRLVADVGRSIPTVALGSLSRVGERTRDRPDKPRL